MRDKQRRKNEAYLLTLDRIWYAIGQLSGGTADGPQTDRFGGEEHWTDEAVRQPTREEQLPRYLMLIRAAEMEAGSQIREALLSLGSKVLEPIRRKQINRA